MFYTEDAAPAQDSEMLGMLMDWKKFQYSWNRVWKKIDHLAASKSIVVDWEFLLRKPEDKQGTLWFTFHSRNMYLSVGNGLKLMKFEVCVYKLS